MQTFRYEAADAQGRIETGTLEADSQRGALGQLRARGLTPLEVREQAGGGTGQGAGALFAPRLSDGDLAWATRQLASLLAASLPLEAALSATLDQAGVLRQAGPFWFDAPDVDALIGFVQWDLLGHTWDLAQAGGLDAPLDEAAASSALAQVLERQEMLIESGRIGQPVDVPADAPVGDRYLGAIGRNPNG